MMGTANAAAMVRDLRARTEALACALVGRDGRVLCADLPPDVYAETFAIMCATVLGAAATANRELGRAAPERIIVDGLDARTILLGCGTDALLVVVAGPSTEAASVIEIAQPFLDLLRRAGQSESSPEGALRPPARAGGRDPRSRNG